MAGKAKSPQISHQEAEIISRLDIFAEYAQLGVRFVGDRSGDKAECFAVDRDERNPSCVVFASSGRYSDSATGINYSLWEFAAKFGSGFADWRAARQHYAQKAGVEVSAKKKKDNPLDVLEFLPWHEGHDRLVDRWCRVHKQGASLEAVKLAGGRVAQYPCWTDQKTGERKKGEYKCVALPCWNHHFPPAPPVAWVIWNINGGQLPVRRGKDLPPDWVKMKSVGETRGTMMGLLALEVLADPAKSAGVERIYKTGGPSDLLAVMAAVLNDPRAAELKEKHLVLTNASSETGDVLPHQIALFSGRNAVVLGDADEAGEFGILKWQQALLPVCAELKCPRLPYVVQKKHGKDVRDFLNGVPAETATELLRGQG